MSNLISFPPPDPRAPDAYGLLSPPEFQFLEPFACAALRYAFYRVHAELGPAVQPPQVADCSMEDGSTPSENGELRHPAGAHDNGINCDITYAMLEAADGDWTIGPNNGAHLTAAPTRLDLPRQARWYEILGELDLEYGGSLLRLAAVDPLAEAPIDAAIDADLGETTDDRNQAKAITFSSYGGGWQSFHHNHSHLRWVARDDGDRIASEIEAKIEALLSQSPGPASPTLPNPSTETGGGDGNKAGPVPATPATPAPSASREPYLWVFLKPEDVEQGDDPGGLIDFFKRCQQIGYNGAVLWDTDLSKNGIEDYVRREYDAVNAWASDARFSLVAQICPQNETIEAWFGVPDCTERGSANGERYICLAHPGVHPVYEKIVDNVLSVFPAGSPLVSIFPFYDEFRLQGTHPRCKKPGGPLLAAHARKTLEIFRAKAPHLRPAVWNDCFDPNHNAVTPYYSVYGGLAGAEAGIDADVLILNWCTKGDSVLDSFRFWADRGNEQVYFGYYDGAGGDGVSAGEERKLIRAVQQNPGVCGYCYTTWEADFDHLEEYLTSDGWARPGGTGAAPPPPPNPPPNPQPATPNTVTIAHGDPWPDLQPGMTVLLGDGDWRTLSFRGEKGTKDRPIIIRAQNPGKVRAAIEITEGNEWVTWDLR